MCSQVVISDVRFQHEVNAIHNMNGIVIKVVRNIQNIDPHVSEKGIDDILDYDFLIQNFGTIKQLHTHIDVLFELFHVRNNVQINKIIYYYLNNFK